MLLLLLLLLLLLCCAVIDCELLLRVGDPGLDQLPWGLGMGSYGPSFPGLVAPLGAKSLLREVVPKSAALWGQSAVCSVPRHIDGRIAAVRPGAAHCLC